MEKDKETEKRRSDERARKNFFTWENEKIEEWNLPPISKYYELIRKNISENHKILEIGSGTGNHTRVLLDTLAEVNVIDISGKSLEVLEKRFNNFKNLHTAIMDIEKLEFKENSFDFVVSAGSLSYGDNSTVMREIYRVLKPGGAYICMDSLNHNIVYRINRRIHVWRGERTNLTIRNMPTVGLIERYRKLFGHIEIAYFVAFIWLDPIVKRLINEKFAAKVINILDRLVNPRKLAFKFVMIARKVI